MEKGGPERENRNVGGKLLRDARAKNSKGEGWGKGMGLTWQKVGKG